MTGSMPLSDEDVVARVVSGDTGAFEILMRRHNQRLYRVARSVVRDEHEAEDIVQEAFVRAYARLGRFEGRSSVATWLTRIAFYEALRRRRRRMLAQRATRSLAEASPGVSGRETGVEMSEATTGARLREAIDALPPGVQSVVILRLVEGLSTRETAASLRLSESNVKVMLHRGTRMLRARLGRGQMGSVREQFTFGAERCDRVVRAVFRRVQELNSP